MQGSNVVVVNPEDTPETGEGASVAKVRRRDNRAATAFAVTTYLDTALQHGNWQKSPGSK